METLMIACLVSSLIAIIIGLGALGVGIFAFIELKSFMRSTHKVEFIPAPDVDVKKKPITPDIFEEFGL